jgi:hypothetical protein
MGRLFSIDAKKMMHNKSLCCTKQLLKDDVRTTERMHLNKLAQNQLHLQSTTFCSFIILSFFGFTASVLTPEDDLMSYLPQELLKECLWHPLM